MRIKNGNYEYIPFARQVNKLAQRNQLLNRFKDDLLQLAELRNAIVHHRADGIHVIAEPHDSTVNQLVNVHDKLTSPTLIYPKFQKTVHTYIQTIPISF